MPLIVNQVEIHLGRLDCFHDGTLDQCIRKNMTPLSWSPLAGGGLMSTRADATDATSAQRVKLATTLDETAARYGVSRAVIALAWLMKHPSKMIPIIGSTNVDHVHDAKKADEVDLSREDWYRLLIAARGEPLP
jgi:predicted oxidoreductase